jgi:hypothetical protein
VPEESRNYVLAIAEKRESMWFWRCAKYCICPRASRGRVAISALCREHGQVGKWAHEKFSMLVATCRASMPPLKAQKDTTSSGERSFIGQGGEVGDRP